MGAAFGKYDRTNHSIAVKRMVDALAVQQHDRVVRYASLEALLRMKRAAGRPKDVAGIAAIEKALGRRER